MTSSTRKTLLSVVVILIVAVGLVLGRNYQLDSAAKALKLGSGVTAVGKLKPLAVLGDRNAQMLLGYTYAYGWAGVPPNDDEAMQWFSRNGLFGTRLPDAEGGPGASEALSVAKAYATGSEGVQANPQESKKWLLLAVRAGSKEAADLSKSP